jgi:hypothetical protein
MKDKTRILVEVTGGIADVTVAPKHAEVEVLDWDNLLGDTGNAQDTKRTWDYVAGWVREYVKENYPEQWEKIMALVKEANEMEVQP